MEGARQGGQPRIWLHLEHGVLDLRSRAGRSRMHWVACQWQHAWTQAVSSGKMSEQVLLVLCFVLHTTLQGCACLVHKRHMLRMPVTVATSSRGH